MGYYRIKKYNIFMDKDKSKRLKEIVLKENKNFKYNDSPIFDPKERKWENKIHYKTLMDMYRKNKEKFIEEWVDFDFIGKNASEITWDILFDYCFSSGKGYLRDNRELGEKILERGSEYSYPMGKKFTLCLEFNKIWFKNIFRIRSGTNLEIVIDVNTVKRIHGKLQDFKLETEYYSIEFSNNVKVEFISIPSNSKYEIY
jgi:hypothetical protein